MNKIKILIPVYNDWKSVFKLLENIDLQIADWDAEVSVLIVNDASTEERPATELKFKKIQDTVTKLFAPINNLAGTELTGDSIDTASISDTDILIFKAITGGTATKDLTKNRSIKSKRRILSNPTGPTAEDLKQIVTFGLN